MDNTKSELYRLKTTVRETKIELDTVSKHNSQLMEEIGRLRSRNEGLVREAHIASSINIELKMDLFKIEAERDEYNSSLQAMKKRYAKLYDSYTEKKQTSNTVQDYMEKYRSRVSTNFRGTVNFDQNVAFRNKNSCDSNDNDVIELQKKLKDAYDIIDELEFELEIVTVLEQENERLTNKLKQLSVNNNDIQNNINNNDDATNRISGVSFHTSRSSINSSNENFHNNPKRETVVEGTRSTANPNSANANIKEKLNYLIANNVDTKNNNDDETNRISGVSFRTSRSSTNNSTNESYQKNLQKTASITGRTSSTSNTGSGNGGNMQHLLSELENFKFKRSTREQKNLLDQIHEE